MKYKKSPIIEALCEIRFDPTQYWDKKYPDLIYNEMQSEFPQRRQSSVLEVQVSQDPEKSGTQVLTIKREQFYRQDESALIQISPRLLSINHLKPYPNWEKFKPLIMNGLGNYLKITKANKVVRIGLRYINRIEIQEVKIDLKDYFNFYPFIGRDLPQDHGAFMVGVQFPYENKGDILKIELSSVLVEKPTFIALGLDLDYFTNESDLKSDDVENWLETAHKHVGAAFEGCISEKLKALIE